MPKGVVSEKRKAAARKHSTRSYTCPCGKECWGNGGWSSHKRSCLTWKVKRSESRVRAERGADDGR
jgi:hypothetical protein